MTEQAIKKLKKELADIKGNCSQYVKAVKTHVAETLIGFCRQDAEFAQAIVQSDKNLGDCCAEIMQGCGQHFSDLEVYRKAVQFYFPGADIQMTMTIDLCASVRGDGGSLPDATEPDDAPAGHSPDSRITLRLEDFL